MKLQVVGCLIHRGKTIPKGTIIDLPEATERDRAEIDRLLRLGVASASMAVSVGEYVANPVTGLDGGNTEAPKDTTGTDKSPKGK